MPGAFGRRARPLRPPGPSGRSFARRRRALLTPRRLRAFAPSCTRSMRSFALENEVLMRLAVNSAGVHLGLHALSSDDGTISVRLASNHLLRTCIIGCTPRLIVYSRRIPGDPLDKFARSIAYRYAGARAKSVLCGTRDTVVTLLIIDIGLILFSATP